MSSETATTSGKGTRLSAAMPLILTAAGGLGIGFLMVRRVASLGFSVAGLWAALACVTYVAWLTWESRVSRYELKKDAATQDRYSMEFAAFSKLCILLATLLPASSPSWNGLVGWVLMVGGILVRGAAIRRLGDRYSHRIRLPVLPLETTGPYSWVRHPAYLGTLVAHLGWVVVFPNLWSLAAWTFLWLPAVVLRTSMEEALMRPLPEYSRYAGQVCRRLIPWCW
jgi:protein-S-isoprenylcysteine O-methyltransferase Ste14